MATAKKTQSKVVAQKDDKPEEQFVQPRFVSHGYMVFDLQKANMIAEFPVGQLAAADLLAEELNDYHKERIYGS